MRPFLTWLTLGAILFLCSCQESSYVARAYQPKIDDSSLKTTIDTTQPTISYTAEIDTMYNENFKLSFEEDLQAFYGRTDNYAENHAQTSTKLTSKDLFRALYATNQPQPVKHVAMHTKLTY